MVPMVVWWRHGRDPSSEVKDSLFDSLSRAADERFGSGRWSIDETMRQVPSHFHAHARDEGWWDKRFKRPFSMYTVVGGERTFRSAPGPN